MADKTLSERIKNALLELGINLPVKKVEPVIVKAEDVTLMDGSILSVDKLEVGSNATFTGADGIPVPAEGEYEAQDGSIIVCAAGVITEIKSKSADTQPEDTAAMKEQLSALQETVNKLTAQFSKVETEKKALEIKLDKNEKVLTDTLGMIDELSKIAAALPLELQKQSKPTGKSFDKELSTEEYNALSNKEKVQYNKLWK